MNLEQQAVASLEAARKRKRDNSVRDLWDELGLTMTASGTPYANTANAATILRKHPDWAGKIWVDTFKGEIVGPNGVWTERDEIELQATMQSQYGLPRIGRDSVRDAVALVAGDHARSSAREWMDGLVWDGKDRLNWLFSAGFGAEFTDYTAAVSKCFMIGAVARVYAPGAKVDALPVLEGAQGRGKSTGLRVLFGDDWFAEATESPASKDFYLSMKGKLLLEIAELDAFGRADITAVKRTVTCVSDRYRIPYERAATDHPRQCVFSATTNTDNWNRDPTGARRFWPVVCNEVSLKWLAHEREQLFAEAVHRYKAGESWWDVPHDDAQREQAARAEGDPWDEVVDRYLSGKMQTTVAAVLEHGIGMPPDRFTKSAEMRVGAILRRMGLARVKRRVDGSPTWVWARE